MIKYRMMKPEFLKNLFNNMGIRTKFLLSFFIAVLIPVIILGIYFINEMTKITVEYTVNNFNMEVDRLERNVAGILETAKDVSDRFFIDEKLQEILISNFQTVLAMTEALRAYTEFDYFTTIHSEISAVRIYTTNNTIRENWRFMRVTPEIKHAPWYNSAVQNRGRTAWSLQNDVIIGEPTLRLARSMPLFEGLPVNVLTVDINVKVVTDLLNEEGFITLLQLSDPLTEDRRYITSGGRNLMLEEDVEQFIHRGNEGSDQNNDFVTIRGANEYFRVVRGMENAYFLNPFQLVSFFPVNRLTTINHSMLYIGLVLIIICLALSTFLILIFTHFSLIKRIRFLSREMRKIVEGDLNISLKLAGQDEIGMLSRDIDKMIYDLKMLIGRVYEADLQKKQFELKQKSMQFKLLASQVNPHFLFNALETIRAKALTNRVADLNSIIKALAKIMRHSLEIQHTLVTVASEIEFAVNYLGIQKYRFEEKLIFTIELPQELKSLKVISHLLQPIVENAVIHGLERKLSPCCILIKVTTGSGVLLFTIEDDGDGIEEEKLALIRQCLQFNRKPEQDWLGIGIMNVHQRVRLYYGNPYGIRIESKKNYGTKVEIALPLEGARRL